MHSLVVLALLAASVFGFVVPTAPGPGEVYNAGSLCSIEWQSDTTGLWTNVTIDLMSGSNQNMKIVRNVISGLDGTNPSLSPYNWTCPDVEPYSAIYFYQFTNAYDVASPQWTTRFTIASPEGSSTTPLHATQPNGDAAPWGNGGLRRKKVDAHTVTTAHDSTSLDSTFDDSEQTTTTEGSSYYHDSDKSHTSVPSRKSHEHVPTTTLEHGGKLIKSRLPSSTPAGGIGPTLHLPPDIAAEETALAGMRVDAINGASRRGATALTIVAFLYATLALLALS